MFQRAMKIQIRIVIPLSTTEINTWFVTIDHTRSGTHAHSRPVTLLADTAHRRSNEAIDFATSDTVLRWFLNYTESLCVYASILPFCLVLFHDKMWISPSKNYSTNEKQICTLYISSDVSSGISFCVMLVSLDSKLNVLIKFLHRC